MEARIGIINRSASFAGGEFSSRSVSQRHIFPLKVAARTASIHCRLLPEDSSKIDFSDLDIVLFCRHASIESLKIHRMCKELNVPTVYDVDDLVTGYPSYFQLGDEKLADTKRILEHLEIADHITVENNQLLRSLPTDILIKASIRENTFSFDDYPLEKLLECRNRKIIFTNAAGLKFDSFRNDFFKVLDLFCDKNDYEVHVFSDLERRVFPLKNMVYRGATSLEEHKHILRTECFDFAVVPLGGEEDSHLSKFNSCKSIIKFIEYSALGIPGIFSNVPPYKDRLISYKNCILAENTEFSWYQSFVELATNNRLNQKIRSQAYDESQSDFSMTNTSMNFIQLIVGLIDGK